MTKQTSYTEAYNELQEIVSEMENAEINIDQLDEKIKRASYLLKICKDRLYKTEQNVKKVLNEISDYQTD